jgi:UDP-glucose 4-epimerase
MRTLITGANGFFGRNLTRAWQDKFDLLLTDLPPQLFKNATREPYEEWRNDGFHCDLCDSMYVVKDHMSGVDTIVHLAAKTRIDPSWSQYKNYYETNIIATQELFHLAQAQNVKRFIYFSSSSVYGNNTNTTQVETDVLAPTNPYALSKMAAETALQLQAQKGNTELTIIRPFTMYGDFMDCSAYSLAISKFLRALEKNEPLVIEGGGSQTRDFVHADDVIQALELILESGMTNQVYNIGTGETVSIKTLADIVSDKQIQAPHRTGAVQRTCADISKLKTLGYKPKIKVTDWLTNRVKEIKLN